MTAKQQRGGKRGRPKIGKAPPGPERVAVRFRRISVADLTAIAASAGLTIVLSESDLPIRAHFINQAYEHYARMSAAERADGAPSVRADWSAGVAAACEHLLKAFADGESGYRHRLQRHLERGFPTDGGDTQSAYRDLRLLLMRGFGPEWREHQVNGDFPDPKELLYLGTPRFLDFAKALLILSQQAEAEWCRDVGTPGGSAMDDLRRNLMMHVCSVYRDLFGYLPTHSDRLGAHPERETFPTGPAIDWFSELFQLLEGKRPTPDAVKNWIKWGKQELSRAAEELVADNADFPE
ncbi:hypothetical protein AAFN86_23510 [Roseomonas sp. CAU 1739]|uniref:hypothetical protein n=1 Tax=Roseomonas sp. CAU 1739 TaxID=3140364 RepID=UPI00325B39F9